MLSTAVRSGNEALVKVALDKGGAKPQTLTAALAASSADAKNAAITEMLKKAGADLTTPETVQETFAVMESYIDRMEKLLK